MIYRNKKTGAEIIVSSEICSPNYELVGEQKSVEVKKEEKKPISAPKKTTKRKAK